METYTIGSLREEFLKQLKKDIELYNWSRKYVVKDDQNVSH